jgi:hypothetical protein
VKKTLTRAALAAALCLPLAACANPPMSGTITHKQYSAAYTYDTYPCIAYTTDYSTYRDSRGNSYTTSSQRCIAWGVHHNYMPARWGLCLKADPGDTEHDAEGCHDVDEVTYRRYDEGSHYPDPR